MKPIEKYDREPLNSHKQHSIKAIADGSIEPPTIVSLSDIHGYLDRARSALLTLTDHPQFDSIVTADDDGTLHWADGNYVLVFNGDLVDRGPANEEVLEMVARLGAEAPPSHVRVTLGNHEAIALCPDHFGFASWYSGQVDPEGRRALTEFIIRGHLVAAYQGYNIKYAHAGSSDPYDVPTVNDALVNAAKELQGSIATIDDTTTQRAVLEKYDRVLGVGQRHLKGTGAGIAWLDFTYLQPTAPPQVVGHTRHDGPTKKGNVFCQNVIRNNIESPGGEAVFIETPDTLSALVREADNSVTLQKLDQHV